MNTYAQLYVCASWEPQESRQNEAEQVIGSAMHQDERRHDGHVPRLVSVQEEGGKRLSKGLTSQFVRAYGRSSDYFCLVFIHSEAQAASHLINGTPESAFKTHWYL